MNAEELLEKEFGITNGGGDDFHNEIWKDWINSMESYAQHKLSEYKENLKEKIPSGEDAYENASYLLSPESIRIYHNGQLWYRNEVLKAIEE